MNVLNILLSAELTDHIFQLIGCLVSAAASGGLTWIATLKFVRRQANADAMKSVQDVYQELVEDIKKDREELRDETKTLHDSYEEKTRELGESVKRITELEKRVATNKRKIAAQDEQIQAMSPLVCTVLSCPNRRRDTHEILHTHTDDE